MWFHLCEILKINLTGGRWVAKSWSQGDNNLVARIFFGKWWNCFGTWWRWWLYDTVNLLNATDVYTSHASFYVQWLWPWSVFKERQEGSEFEMGWILNSQEFQIIHPDRQVWHGDELSGQQHRRCSRMIWSLWAAEQMRAWPLQSHAWGTPGQVWTLQIPLPGETQGTHRPLWQEPRLLL